MTFDHIQLVSKTDEGYQIYWDMERGELGFSYYGEVEIVSPTIPSEKEIKKRIEKKQKSL